VQSFSFGGERTSRNAVINHRKDGEHREIFEILDISKIVDLHKKATEEVAICDLQSKT
jgi:hypothetical protein